VSRLLAAAPALPLGHAGKFVAGAYVVVFLVVLVYVAIMAIRAQRTERDLEQLQREVEAVRASAQRPSPSGHPVSGETAPDGSAPGGDPERSGTLL
jgi:heme exporter protein CcmD